MKKLTLEKKKKKQLMAKKTPATQSSTFNQRVTGFAKRTRKIQSKKKK